MSLLLLKFNKSIHWSVYLYFYILNFFISLSLFLLDFPLLFAFYLYGLSIGSINWYIFCFIQRKGGTYTCYIRTFLLFPMTLLKKMMVLTNLEGGELVFKTKGTFKPRFAKTSFAWIISQNLDKPNSINTGSIHPLHKILCYSSFFLKDIFLNL